MHHAVSGVCMLTYKSRVSTADALFWCYILSETHEHWCTVRDMMQQVQANQQPVKTCLPESRHRCTRNWQEAEDSRSRPAQPFRAPLPAKQLHQKLHRSPHPTFPWAHSCPTHPPSQARGSSSNSLYGGRQPEGGRDKEKKRGKAAVTQINARNKMQQNMKSAGDQT